MPREYDDDGWEIERTFTVSVWPPETKWAQAGRPFEVRCFRNGRYSGGTPYSKADALACVKRLLADGWTIKLDSAAETLDAILELYS